MKKRLMKFLAGGIATVALMYASAQDTEEAYAQEGIVKIVKVHQQNCGITNNPKLSIPYTRLSADINGDGQLEHFVANGAVIEEHEMSSTGTLTLKERLYDHNGNKYDCVNLGLDDMNNDGYPDLFYSSDRLVVMLNNEGGVMKAPK